MRIKIILLLLCFPLSAFCQNVLELNSLERTFNLNPYMVYHLDEDGSQEIDNITKLSTGYFVPIGEEGARFPNTNAVLWLKFICKNTQDQREEFIIDFIDPSLYVIELYYPTQDGGLKKTVSGTSKAQNEKSIKGNRNNLWVELDPDVETTLYLKIHSTNNMTISAEIMNDEIALENNIDERTFIGLFYGALITLMIYNLLLFIITGTRVFLINGLYTFLVSLLTGSADGFTAQYFHFLVSWTNGYQDVFIAASSNIVSLLFMRDFLRVSEWSHGYDKGLKWFIYGIVGALALVALIYPRAIFVYLSYIGILVLLVTLFLGVLSVRENRPQARYFLAAYLIFGVFILFFILSILRIIPYGVLVKYSIHFGYLSCISILSFGLSVKIYELYLELLEKEKEKKNIIKLKNQELEEKVIERTKSIQNKEINLRSILNNTDDSIWLVNDNYEIIDFNKAFFDGWKMAYNTELKFGTKILDTIPNPEIKKLWEDRYAEASKNKKSIYQDVYTINGEKRYYEINVFPISYEGKVTGISFFSKEVTKRTTAQQQLLTQNEVLKKVNKELDSFVYSASHDLKAPLASVLGLIGLLRRETDDTNRDQYYNMMEKSIVRLDQFIKDIIDYSRNSRIEPELEEIDLKGLIVNAFDDLKYIDGAEATQKVIDIDEDLRITSDSTRLRVIVRNILSNAMKYGHKHGNKPKIQVSALRENGHLLLSIEDNGPGIPKDQKEKIFEYF